MKKNQYIIPQTTVTDFIASHMLMVSGEGPQNVDPIPEDGITGS